MAHDLPEAEVELEVPFYDLDPAEIVWFGNIYKYFDQARSELMKTIEYGMVEMRESGYFWPVIESKCRHKNPMEFGDRVRIHAELVEYENRLKINYIAHRLHDEERVALGHTVQVAVDIETGEMRLQSPGVLFDKLEIPESDRPDQEL